MNKIETKRIENELIKLGFEITNTDSNILHFAKKDYSGPLIYRDENKNLCKLNTFYHVHFNAETNPNGVGDGKNPKKALTYSIGLSNNGTMRRFREKHFGEYRYHFFYEYSRDLKSLVEMFKMHLKSIKVKSSN